jgi:hypothetical protein
MTFGFIQQFLPFIALTGCYDNFFSSYICVVVIKKKHTHTHTNTLNINSSFLHSTSSTTKATTSMNIIRDGPLNRMSFQNALWVGWGGALIGGVLTSFVFPRSTTNTGELRRGMFRGMGTAVGAFMIYGGFVMQTLVSKVVVRANVRWALMRQGNDGGDSDKDDDDANDDDDDNDNDGGDVVVDNGDGDSTSVGETEETIVAVARTTVEPDLEEEEEEEEVVVEEAYAQHVEVEEEETQNDGETGSATDSAEEEGIELASSNAQ